MEEGPNSNGGLATDGNADDFSDSNNSMMPTGLGSLSEGMGETQYVINDKDGGKSKRWLAVGIVSGVLLLLVIAFVVLKQTGVVEKVMSGGRKSSAELVEKLEQANYDLSNLSIEYNKSFDASNENSNNINLYTRRDFEVIDNEYSEVEDEINGLPTGEQTVLKDEDRELYNTYVNEMKKRFNTVKEGKDLLKEFQLSFFSPLVEYAEDPTSEVVEYDGKGGLLNSENGAVNKVANEFEGLDQIVRGGGGQEEINVYLNEHVDLLNDFMQCFETVEDPDAFYDDVNDFLRSIRKRYGVS